MHELVISSDCEAGQGAKTKKHKSGTSPYERYGAGLNHWGLAMESKEAVVELRERLIAAGIEAQPLQDLGGATALFLPDSVIRQEFVSLGISGTHAPSPAEYQECWASRNLNRVAPGQVC